MKREARKVKMGAMKMFGGGGLVHIGNRGVIQRYGDESNVRNVRDERWRDDG